MAGLLPVFIGGLARFNYRIYKHMAHIKDEGVKIPVSLGR